jgi:hypothetical protein
VRQFVCQCALFLSPLPASHCLSLSAFCLFVHLFVFIFVILSLLFLPGINHDRNLNPEQTQAGRYYTVLRNTGVIPAVFGAKIGSVVGNNVLPKQV